ncbi:MAG: hypothetical protein CVV27_08730 [Candidatus Melainabacteria bacterium HGW-Melainabacteria-1]|nr:MAG: hypothetical protein CVV27_08730 [Candidatus Melainabacteria bacterium HGW-Melainabacteria-1]
MTEPEIDSTPFLPSDYPIIAGQWADFAAAVALFNQGQFFAAHEAWEALWIHSAGPEKTLLQGLIQLSVALHHHQRGNHKGAAGVFRRAQMRILSLSPIPWLSLEGLDKLSTEINSTGAADGDLRPQIRILKVSD